MRASSYIAVAGLAILLGVYETSYLGSLPGSLHFVHPMVSFLAIYFLLKRPQAAYLTAAVSGLVVDLISSEPSGFAIARWLLTAFFLDLLSENIITNKSLYGSWILVAGGWLFENVIVWITYVFYLLILDREFIVSGFMPSLMTLAANIVIITVLFLGTSFFTKRFLTYIPFVKDRYGG